MVDLRKPDPSRFGGWSIDEAEWEWLKGFCWTHNIKSVVEFGAGTSTLLFSQIVPTLVSYESDTNRIPFYKDISEVLPYKGHDIRIPLQEIDGGKLRTFDLAFVDGPPAMGVPSDGYARMGTMIAAKRCANIVIVHDSKRGGETNSIEVLFKGWKREQCSSSQRGMTVLYKPQVPDNILLTSVVTDNYVELLETFMYSVVRNGEIGTPPWKIIYSEDRLTVENRMKLSNAYPFLFLHRIDKGLYEKYEKGLPRFWSFDAFLEVGTGQKVIFLDADLLCLRSMAPILNYSEGLLGMVSEQHRPSYNAGVMVIDPELQDPQVYEELLATPIDPTRFGTDQQIYNRYFAGSISAMSQSYNTLATEVPKTVWGVPDISNVILLHYIHKPNHPEFKHRLRPELIGLWSSERMKNGKC